MKQVQKLIGSFLRLNGTQDRLWSHRMTIGDFIALNALRFLSVIKLSCSSEPKLPLAIGFLLVHCADN